jgi:hypothetical protein
MTANAWASSGRPLMDKGMAPRPMDLNVNPVLPSSRNFMDLFSHGSWFDNFGFRV